MISRPQLLGSLLGVVALGLTVLGVSFALTDSNSSGASDAALALHNRNPTSAQIDLTISTGQRYDVSGTADFNFVRGTAQLTLAVPTVFSTTTVRAVLANHHVYVGSSALDSLTKKSWIAVSISPAFELFSIEGELVKTRLDLPLLRLLPGLNQFHTEKTTHDGPFTTFTFSNRHFPLTSTSSTSSAGSLVPRTANVTLAVTVASAGQLSELKLSANSSTLSVSVDAKVLSYNSPVTISVPRADQVQPFNSALARQLFNSKNSPLAGLFSTQQAAQLRRILAG